MSVFSVRAPANVKISGEHSVVYGGLSLSAAINLYATATIEDTNKETFDVLLEDFKSSISLSANKLARLNLEYSNRNRTTPEGIAAYASKNQGLGKAMLPYVTIAARLFAEHGIKLMGKKIILHSDVPVQKGYASSAACSTAFAMAIISQSSKRIDDDFAIDIARDGERIVHGVESAGRLDVGPAYFGGFSTFSASEGIKSADITAKPNFVVIDTGPKPPTSEMVGKVRKLYEKDSEGTTKIFEQIDECVKGCIGALKSYDMKDLGKQMSKNQELLKKLGVSSKGIDKALSIALSSGAYGAKLCGGGGGGMCIAIADEEKSSRKIISDLKKAGFGAFEVVITSQGASSYAQKKN